VTVYVKASQICVMHAKPWHKLKLVKQIMQFFLLHKITRTKNYFSVRCYKVADIRWNKIRNLLAFP